MKCTIDNCVREGVVRVLEVRNHRAHQEEEVFCEEHSNARWQAHFADDWPIFGSKCQITGASPFDLELIMAYEKKQVYTALLREVGGKRLVFLPIGYLEVCILYYAVLDSPYSQLFLHTIMLRVIQSLEGQLTNVIVDDVDSHWYFKAKLVFLKNQKIIEFQIRPSDALILANLANTPFLIKESVITKIKENEKFGRV